MTAVHHDCSTRNNAQLRNRSAMATVGAYHLSPLGAGFFMPADPSRRSELEAKR